MKSTIIFPMMFISVLSFADKTMSVEEAVKKKLVSVSVTGKGGYTGEVIQIKLKNLLKKPVSVDVEAGRRFDSEESHEQDILVNKAVTLALSPNQTKIFTISGMCCQAHNSSPGKGSAFAIGKMADTNLVKLARFIDTNKWYGDGTAQRAVWIVSDHNRMEDIGGDDPVSKKLQQFVSKLTGREIPKYRVDYGMQSGENNGAVYTGVPAKISGIFNFEIFSNGLVTFGIYDAEGHAVQMFIRDRPVNKGSYGFKYAFKASDLPKGDYYARLRLDGQVKKEEKFTF
jgi:hypothetical protein